MSLQSWRFLTLVLPRLAGAGFDALHLRRTDAAHDCPTDPDEDVAPYMECVDALRASVSEPPEVVVDRQTSANEPVSRAWPGLGALAFIGFNHFSVSPGDLVRLADAPDGTHRFGFCWQRDQDAIILHWIAAQESAKYLQAP